LMAGENGKSTTSSAGNGQWPKPRMRPAAASCRYPNGLPRACEKRAPRRPPVSQAGKGARGADAPTERHLRKRRRTLFAEPFPAMAVGIDARLETIRTTPPRRKDSPCLRLPDRPPSALGRSHCLPAGKRSDVPPKHNPCRAQPDLPARSTPRRPSVRTRRSRID